MIPLNFPDENGNIQNFECYIMFMGFHMQVRCLNWKGDSNVTLEEFMRRVFQDLDNSIEDYEVNFDDFEYFYMAKKKIVG